MELDKSENSESLEKTQLVSKQVTREGSVNLEGTRMHRDERTLSNREREREREREIVFSH